jgi:hypothetical protein
MLRDIRLVILKTAVPFSPLGKAGIPGRAGAEILMLKMKRRSV